MMKQLPLISVAIVLLLSTPLAGTANATPLHNAAESGYVNTVRRLLESGVAVDIRDGGATPLHSAAWKGHVDVIWTLIKAGADVNARDALNLTPLRWAVMSGHTDAAKILRAAGGVETSLRISTNARRFHDAADSGDVKSVRLLIEAGVEVDVRDGGSTPLHRAARKGHIEVIQMLIKSGADVNARDSLNLTPLSWAMMSSRADAAKILRAAGGVETKLRMP